MPEDEHHVILGRVALSSIRDEGVSIDESLASARRERVNQKVKCPREARIAARRVPGSQSLRSDFD